MARIIRVFAVGRQNPEGKAVDLLGAKTREGPRNYACFRFLFLFGRLGIRITMQIFHSLRQGQKGGTAKVALRR
jgi:hypothetical protein